MPEFDINAASAQIGKDLFGGGDTGSVNEGAGDSTGSEGILSDVQTGSEGSLENPATNSPPPISMPKAWKKEKEPLWAKLDREAQEYVNARESDVLKGFEQYSSSHKQWNELVSPFQDVLKQYPDVNPVQVMQTLMRNHLAIVRAAPEQKAQLAQILLKSYGIELPGADTGTQNPGQEDPRIHALQQELQGMRSALQSFQQQQFASAEKEALKHVQAFAQDPKNKYFEKVAPQVVHFLKTGAAEDLASAYELAIYANPEVRAMILADQQSAQTQNPNNPKPVPNVQGNGEGTPRAKTPKTWQETVDAIASKHATAH